MNKFSQGITYQRFYAFAKGLNNYYARKTFAYHVGIVYLSENCCLLYVRTFSTSHQLLEPIEISAKKNRPELFIAIIKSISFGFYMREVE